MDEHLAQLILNGVNRTEDKVDSLTNNVGTLDTRITSLEIEVRMMNKRMNGFNGVAKEVEEMVQCESCKERSKKTRHELIKIVGCIIGSMGVAASVTVSIIALLC